MKNKIEKIREIEGVMKKNKVVVSLFLIVVLLLVSNIFSLVKIESMNNAGNNIQSQIDNLKQTVIAINEKANISRKDIRGINNQMGKNYAEYVKNLKIIRKVIYELEIEIRKK